MPVIVIFNNSKLIINSEQRHADAPYVDWTVNIGFIVANADSLHLLEEAYKYGDYNFVKGDGSFQSIWQCLGDQSALNHVLWTKRKFFELHQCWNGQPVLAFFINDKGWDIWRKNRFYRLQYFFRMALPFNYADPFKKKFFLLMAFI